MSLEKHIRYYLRNEGSVFWTQFLGLWPDELQELDDGGHHQGERTPRARCRRPPPGWAEGLLKPRCQRPPPGWADGLLELDAGGHPQGEQVGTDGANPDRLVQVVLDNRHLLQMVEEGSAGQTYNRPEKCQVFNAFTGQEWSCQQCGSSRNHIILLCPTWILDPNQFIENICTGYRFNWDWNDEKNGIKF